MKQAREVQLGGDLCGAKRLNQQVFITLDFTSSLDLIELR